MQISLRDQQPPPPGQILAFSGPEGADALDQRKIALLRKGQTQRPPLQRGMQPCKSAKIHISARGRKHRKASRKILRLGLEAVVLRRQDFRRSANRRLRLGNPAANGGENRMAQIIAQIRALGVCFILAPGKRNFLRRLPQRFPGNIQQRPPGKGRRALREGQRGPRPHSGQPARAAAPEKMQQHGFRLILLMMRQRYRLGPRADGAVGDRLIAGGAGLLLAAASQRDASQKKGNIPRRAAFRHKLRILPGNGAQPMIHMHRRERQFFPAG